SANTPSLSPKRRTIVCTVTPECLAMSASVMSAMTFCAKRCLVATRIFSAVCAAAAARVVIRYGLVTVFMLVILTRNCGGTETAEINDGAAVSPGARTGKPVGEPGRVVAPQARVLRKLPGPGRLADSGWTGKRPASTMRELRPFTLSADPQPRARRQPVHG